MICGGSLLLNMGINTLGAGKSSLINMLEPVTSMAVSVIAFGYALSFSAVAGCALILGALGFQAASSGNKGLSGLYQRSRTKE